MYKGATIRLSEEFLAEKNIGQKGVRWYIQRAKRENLPTKNTISSKTVLQKWKRNKDLSRQTKAKGIHHHHMCLTRNTKGSPLSWKERMLDNNTKAYKNIKLSGEGK